MHSPTCGVADCPAEKGYVSYGGVPAYGLSGDGGNDAVVNYLLQMQGSGFWYMAQPYSKHPAGREQAAVDGCIAAGWLINRGVRVFAPIPHSHYIAKFGNVDPASHAIWLDQDRAMCQHAVGIVVVKMPTWESSVGVNEERKWFAQWGKPEVQVNWPLDGGVQ